jgi:hypothetical protein
VRWASTPASSPTVTGRLPSRCFALAETDP